MTNTRISGYSLLDFERFWKRIANVLAYYIYYVVFLYISITRNFPLNFYIVNRSTKHMPLFSWVRTYRKEVFYRWHIMNVLAFNCIWLRCILRPTSFLFMPREFNSHVVFAKIKVLRHRFITRFDDFIADWKYRSLN